MKEAKFTKGEWCTTTFSNGQYRVRVNGSDYKQCDIANTYGDKGEANAHLIAAAPDIYRAAMNAMALFERLGMQHTEEYRELAKASKKARGE